MTKNEKFHFKQFTVVQHTDAGMKVGTDGVLVGAWCRVEPGQKRLLDIGTGTGVIALMLAQRSPSDAHIDAIDINPDSCAQASRNAGASPWPDKITVIEIPVQSYSPRTPLYDHIVSNPPYFESSLRPPSPGRSAARHTVALSYDDLARSVGALLAPEGIFSVILPSDSTARFCASAAGCGLALVRRTDVCPKEGSAPKRTLMEFVRIKGPLIDPVCDTLCITGPSGAEFTDQYKALTRDFYLKF